jgi:hypothetical protein
MPVRQMRHVAAQLDGDHMTDRCICWDDKNPPLGARCKKCGRIVPGSLGHHCHARGCATKVKPELLMCGKDWRRVPRKIQMAVYAAYRLGQCNDMNPSAAWHVAADAAIGYVAALDDQPIRPEEVEALASLGYDQVETGAT